MNVRSAIWQKRWASRGPAGDHDVWHFHLHVIPRFRDDGLRLGERVLYDADERSGVARRLRLALERR
jgi:histidine triad (HIT) family protein